ncbi:helix-turn-helix transcriptional regulator [Oscillibacter sp.]|uniref:helix-turn-helix domain-containing protein n=1 Tax=Oscillibacter sp. TaxID=1945593 RepID=UPI0028991B6B|nr:helix-turn-helix transcriptional regulator [Oscillibacter sp.]
MYDLYEIIKSECEKNGITVSAMCLELGMSKSMMSDLHSGKKKSLSAEKLSKIANYFNVSVDYLLTGEQKNQAPIDVVDEDLRDYLDELRNRPEMRMLFSTTKNATKAQIEAIVKMVEEMQGDR